jgi:cyanophycinase
MNPIINKPGELFLIGGAEDKKKDKRLLQQMVDQTRGEIIAFIPTASAYPRDIFEDYSKAFNELGIPKLHCLDVRYRDEADREEHLEAIEEADLVFFGGGDQVKLVRMLTGTRLFEHICRRFEQGQLNIAGTSAGAAAAGNPMIYNGDRRGFKKGTIKSAPGFGFVHGVTIDTHFLARRRLSRLAQFLLSGKYAKGIGVDEDTAIRVLPNLQFSVFGTGVVTVLNSIHVTGSNYHDVAQGEKLAFNNMRIVFLPQGTTFSIKKWSILNQR